MKDNKMLTNTFMWLFVGLLICFGVSYGVATDDGIMEMIYGISGSRYLLYIILEVVLALALSFGLGKMNPLMAKICYILYTALTGLSISGVFIVYKIGSIAFAFLATAIIFGVFAVIGKTTNVDLSKFSTYLFVALLAIIILEVINIFLMNNSLDMILCIAGIVVFAGYVAYDIKHAMLMAENSSFENASIYCAFQLFLDIINLFLKILRLFGKEND